MAIPMRMNQHQWNRVLNALEENPKEEELYTTIKDEMDLIGDQKIDHTIPIMLTTRERRVVFDCLRKQP